MPVFDLKGRRIGRVKDAALVPLVHSSRIDRLLVGGGDAWLTIRYDQIRSISLDQGIHLSDEQLIPYHDDEYMLRIARDLLDQQIIDVTGRKVVRVNDVTFGDPARWRARHPHGARSRYRHAQHPAPPAAGRAAAALDPPAAAPHSAELHPLGVRQRRGARPAAPPAPEHLLPEAGRHAPGRPGRHRRGTEPRRARSHLRNHRQRSGRRRALRSRSQDAGQHPGIAGAGEGRRHRRRDGAGRGRRRALRTRGGDLAKRFSTRWIRSPRPKSASCWNSKRTPPAA